MKKPVRRRKGYAGGGLVDVGSRVLGDISESRTASSKALGASEDAVDRARAGDAAGSSVARQRADIADSVGRYRSSKYPESQPEGWPSPGGQYSTESGPQGLFGKAKGGKVTKVLRKAPARGKR